MDKVTIPDEAWMALRQELVDGPLREDMEDRYKHAIRAMLAAWPGVIHHRGGWQPIVTPRWPHIILPLAQEPSHD